MQGFRERETVAQTHESTDDRTLSQIVGEMEVSVRDLHAWGRAVHALGCGGSDVEPDTLAVIGRAITGTADDLCCDWQKCFNLIHGRGGV